MMVVVPCSFSTPPVVDPTNGPFQPLSQKKCGEGSFYVMSKYFRKSGSNHSLKPQVEVVVEDPQDAVLPYVELSDLVHVNEVVCASTFLRSHQIKFSAVSATPWSLPPSGYVVNQEFVNEFCNAHGLMSMRLARPPAPDEITRAILLLRHFFKTRDRIQEALHQFCRGLRVIKKHLLSYVRKRRNLLGQVVEQWSNREIEERQTLRERISARVAKLRPMKRFDANVMRSRNVMDPEEVKQFNSPLIPEGDKRFVVKELFRKSVCSFHRRYREWRRCNAKKLELLRVKTINLLGTLLCFWEVVYRSHIPETPAFVFQPAPSELNAEYRALQAKRDEAHTAACRADIQASIRERYRELALSTERRLQNQHSSNNCAKSLGGNETLPALPPKFLFGFAADKRRAVSDAPGDWLEACPRVEPLSALITKDLTDMFSDEQIRDYEEAMRAACPPLCLPTSIRPREVRNFLKKRNEAQRPSDPPPKPFALAWELGLPLLPAAQLNEPLTSAQSARCDCPTFFLTQPDKEDIDPPASARGIGAQKVVAPSRPRYVAPKPSALSRARMFSAVR